jgi:hypothetical protein
MRKGGCRSALTKNGNYLIVNRLLPSRFPSHSRRSSLPLSLSLSLSVFLSPRRLRHLLILPPRPPAVLPSPPRPPSSPGGGTLTCDRDTHRTFIACRLAALVARNTENQEEKHSRASIESDRGGRDSGAEREREREREMGRGRGWATLPTVERLCTRLKGFSLDFISHPITWYTHENGGRR